MANTDSSSDILATWATAVMTSPDLQMDIAAISQDIYEGDKTSLGLDIAGAVLPGVSGLGRVSKSVKTASKLSKKGVLKNADLPTKGKIRYISPKKWTPSQPLPKGKNNEFIDKFGNEWVKGPPRTANQSFEWDVQLSNTGKSQLGKFTRDGSHLNVSLDGHITHK